MLLPLRPTAICRCAALGLGCDGWQLRRPLLGTMGPGERGLALTGCDLVFWLFFAAP